MRHKNNIELVMFDNQQAIKKQYRYPIKMKQEIKYLELLQDKINVPTILEKQEDSLVLSYIQAKSVKQCMEQYEQEDDVSSASSLLTKVMNYLREFHQCTGYKICRNDNHFDNYLLYHNQIVGIDFEETKQGDYKEDYVNLLGFFLCYDPINSDFKRQLFDYAIPLLKDIFTIQELHSAVEKQVNRIMVRRKLKQANIAACIVAGGKATRMNGINKGNLLLEEYTFIDTLTMTLSFIDSIYVSLSKQRDIQISLPKIYDEIEDIGPIGGIYSVLKNVLEEQVFFVACDSPFLKENTVQMMHSLALDKDVDCVVAVNEEGKYQPLCAVYKKSCLPFIQEVINKKEYRTKSLFNRLQVKTFQVENYELQNMNTYDQYIHLKIR